MTREQAEALLSDLNAPESVVVSTAWPTPESDMCLVAIPLCDSRILLRTLDRRGGATFHAVYDLVKDKIRGCNINIVKLRSFCDIPIERHPWREAYNLLDKTGIISLLKL
jgi:hypothetical protein